MAFLQKRDEQMIRKLENEKKRSEDIARVREDHQEKMRQLKQASVERQMKLDLDAETNSKNKSLNKQNKKQRIDELYNSKKQIHAEVQI